MTTRVVSQEKSFLRIIWGLDDFSLANGRESTQHGEVSLCARNILLSCHKKKTVKMFSNLRLGPVIVTYLRLYTKNEVSKVAEGESIQV